MNFNLVHEKWIPIRRKDGTETKIAPWEITADYLSNPVVALDAPRPDFKGAHVQFLIGLIQTTIAPVNEEEWEDLFFDPPRAERLKEAFSSVSHAFNLGGGGPRFMQEREPLDGNAWGIDKLIIDAPGENSLRNNRDLFMKRGTISMLCPSCCATALFAMQTNAPSGGSGHRTSLRGGGPLSTLVLPGGDDNDSLWNMLWLNILEKDVFLRTSGNAGRTAERDIFPWLAATRTSEKRDGRDTTPQDAHPAQMFWGMPRRIGLDLENCASGECPVCGEMTPTGILRYRTQNYGVNYAGAWLHPLSPYSRKDGVPLPLHAQPGGISYRHWLGLVQEDTKLQREPARIVHHFRESRQLSGQSFRLWAFGYDMDNMTARCWYESIMPLVVVPTAIREDYEFRTAGMVRAAHEVAENLRKCVKKAWFNKPGEVKGDTGIIVGRFWQNTEGDFYVGLENLRSALGDDNEEALIAVMRSWHMVLCRTSQIIFDSLAWEGPIEHANPKRVVLARRDLARFNSSKKILVELLGLPAANRVAQ